jgi:hypothetical protein
MLNDWLWICRVERTVPFDDDHNITSSVLICVICGFSGGREVLHLPLPTKR